MNDGERYDGEAQHDAAESRREQFEFNDARPSALAQAVERAAEEEGTKALLVYARGQRDVLAKAARATVMFHALGGLITREQAEKWRLLTGDSDFSAQGLYDFVQRQMVVAGLVP